LSSPCTPSLILCITCLVPALYPLLSCIPCLGSAPQYILCAYSVHSFQVCITSTSILASLRCTCFVIARQILSTPCRHSGQTPHRPRRTLRPTDRNSRAGKSLMLGMGMPDMIFRKLCSSVIVAELLCRSRWEHVNPFKELSHE
jgi:hypothetical protein